MQLTWAKPYLESQVVANNGLPVCSSERAWYAAYTVPRHEKAAAAHLNQKTIETYLPLGEFPRRWGGRRVLVSLPLFPGYIFVRISASQRSSVLEHPSILRLVTFAGRPVAMPDAEIERLRTALKSRAAEPFPFLAPGRRIRIKSGPLLGLEGTIVRRRGRVRFVVSIDSIQRSIAFDVDASDLTLMN